MRIAIYLEGNYNNKIGGGFSYVEQIVLRLLSIKCSHEFLPFFIINENQDLNNTFFYSTLKSNGKEVLVLKNDHTRQSIFLRILRKFATVFKINGLENIVSNFQNIEVEKHEISEKARVDNFLKENDIHLLYYPLPMPKKHGTFPFFCTVWDLIHLKAPYFPEVSENNQFVHRERMYSEILREASAIVAESKQGKGELLTFYNLNPEKIIVQPMPPSSVIQQIITEDDHYRFLEKNSLTKKGFFYYPANFWPHKNHYNLLKSFSLLIGSFPDIKLVLTGADWGNWAYLKEQIDLLKLNDYVINLGFVTFKEVKILYETSYALIMCTMYDPTSIPLIEAMACHCPIICTDTLGHREQTNNNALFIKAESAEDIASKICYSLMHNEEMNQMADLAFNHYRDQYLDVEKSFTTLTLAFDNFESYRKTWS